MKEWDWLAAKLTLTPVPPCWGKAQTEGPHSAAQLANSTAWVSMYNSQGPYILRLGNSVLSRCNGEIKVEGQCEIVYSQKTYHM